MRCAWIIRCALVLAAPLDVVGAGWSRGGEEPAARRFVLVLDSHANLKEPGKSGTMPIDALTQFTYDLTPRPGAVDVSIHSIDLTMKTGGKALTSHFDRSESRTRNGGQERVAAYDKAPPALRKIMEEYDRPVATIELDSEGSETGRTLKVDSKSLFVVNGTIDITRIFHVRFPEGKDRWEAPAKLPMGTGQYARGTLKYQKLPSNTAGGPVRVKVSGELGLAGKMGGGEVKDGTFTVSGEQVYDPAGRGWSSGVLDIVLKYDIEVNAKPAGSASGTIKVTLQRLAPSPTKPPPSREDAT
jgi:hypothetical protein